MQTLPTFVYLIPTLVLFGLGVVPGLISTVIFALPAPIRLTQLGISSVPEALLEAGQAFTSVGEFPPQLLGRDESAWVGQDHNWWYGVSLTRERPEPVPVTRGRVIGGYLGPH